MSDNNKFNEAVGRMRSLIERMEKPHTNYQALLNEEKCIKEAATPGVRVLKSPDELFDLLSGIKDYAFVTFGYVSGANLNLPKVKRLNPETNRMKGYDDYSVFSEEGEDEITGLIKFAVWNVQYTNLNTFNKNYGKYVDGANEIRGRYGLDPMAKKENDYKEKIDYGNGVSMYSGSDQDKVGNFYMPLNTYGVKPIQSTVYAVNKDGHIIKALSEDQVAPYLKAKGEASGVSALRKMEKSEEEIKKYTEELGKLKFNYGSFIGPQLMFFTATVDGVKSKWINQWFSKAVSGVNVNKDEFIALAEKWYENAG